MCVPARVRGVRRGPARVYLRTCGDSLARSENSGVLVVEVRCNGWVARVWGVYFLDRCENDSIIY